MKTRSSRSPTPAFDLRRRMNFQVAGGRRSGRMVTARRNPPDGRNPLAETGRRRRIRHLAQAAPAAISPAPGEQNLPNGGVRARPGRRGQDRTRVYQSTRHSTPPGPTDWEFLPRVRRGPCGGVMINLPCRRPSPCSLQWARIPGCQPGAARSHTSLRKLGTHDQLTGRHFPDQARRQRRKPARRNLQIRHEGSPGAVQRTANRRQIRYHPMTLWRP